MENSSLGLWNFCAFAYNKSIKGSVSHRKQFEDILSKLKPRIGKKYLDIGCGSGDFEVIFGKNYPKILLESIDFSENMVSHAKKRNINNKNIHIGVGNAAGKLDFPDESFDGIVCINALFAIPETDKVLSEIYRLLSKGGRLVVADPKPDANMGYTFVEYFKETKIIKGFWGKFIHFISGVLIFPFALVVLVLNLIMVYWGKSNKYHFFGKNAFITILSEVGFTRIEITETLAKQDWLIVAEKKC